MREDYKWKLCLKFCNWSVLHEQELLPFCTCNNAWSNSRRQGKQGIAKPSIDGSNAPGIEAQVPEGVIC